MKKEGGEKIILVLAKIGLDKGDNFNAAQMTREYEGMKDGGDGITPGNKVNYFFIWRKKDSTGKTTELVNVTITRGGQVVVFDNDTYDLKKNSN